MPPSLRAFLVSLALSGVWPLLGGCASSVAERHCLRTMQRINPVVPAPQRPVPAASADAP